MKKLITFMTLILAVFSDKIYCQNLTNNLVSYWTFDGSANDVKGNNNGTVMGASISQSGKIGGCYSFDGVNDYIECVNNATINITGAISLSAWINTNSTSPQLILCKPPSSNSHIDPWVVYGLSVATVNGTFLSSMSVTTNGTISDARSDAISTNGWHHIVGVYNQNNLLIYIDGSLHRTVALTGNIGTYATPLRIGTNGGYTECFNGLMDEIGIWNRALTAAEVTSLYNAGNGLSYPFGTTTAPTVTTTATSNIAQTTATSGGNVISNGGATLTARGVCWSTSSNPTTSNSKTNDGTATGTFTSSITGLTAGTTYHIRAYASNSVGTSYGSDVQFTTSSSPVVPVVTTTSITNITQTTATSGGNVTSDGGATVTARGVCWSTSANPTTALSTKTTNGTGTGSFTSSITGLTAGNTYHVRAYATNSVGTSYGSDLSFIASDPVTTAWQNNGSNVYYSGGNVGIGTATPSQPLTVNGKILAKEVEVVSSIASDYVFEPEYQLMPLTELELYLKQNKHLPGIPSVAEFSKQGQNLGKMDDMLLRKIEELTLYMLELRKEDEDLKASELELKKENKELKARMGKMENNK